MWVVSPLMLLFIYCCSSSFVVAVACMLLLWVISCCFCSLSVVILAPLLYDIYVGIPSYETYGYVVILK